MKASLTTVVVGTVFVRVSFLRANIGPLVPLTFLDVLYVIPGFLPSFLLLTSNCYLYRDNHGWRSKGRIFFWPHRKQCGRIAVLNLWFQTCV